MRPSKRWLLVLALAAASAQAQEATPEIVGIDPRPPPATLLIQEYRLEGSTLIPQLELEQLLAPYLGPGRRREDIEAARAALQKLYLDRGYPSVSVFIPEQRVRGGVVTLKVVEAPVGRLRVRGARWFTLSQLRREAPSLQEGRVPNVDALMHDILVMNQLPDRRVTPMLRAGVAPGTVDADLVVEDTFPLHGSLELNDRQSAGTTPLRLNGTVHYDNLFQEGHAVSLSFQTAPARLSEARVFSLTYTARFLEDPDLLLSVNGVLQDSDISTLGAEAVRGRGRTAGLRFGYTLPAPVGLFHSLTLGVDLKLYGKEQASDPYARPIRYAPVLLQYGGAWSGPASTTLFTLALVYNLRPFSSDDGAFDARRYGASATFLRASLDASRSQGIAAGFQVFGRLQGFLSPDPLLPSEQFSAGGVETVRGYLEAQAAGDKAALGTLELRSPILARGLGVGLEEWRVYAFGEGGRVWLNQALAEQQAEFTLWSVGLGTRFRARRLSGGLDVGVPLRRLATTERLRPRYQFRLATEF